MHIPTLHTERLDLLPPSAACAQMYDAFYTDADASRPYGGPLTSAAAWSRLAADLGAWHLQGFGVWAIQQRDCGDLLGVCGFWQGKDWPRELTWWLLPKARGAGTAQEASRAVIEHAFHVFRWESVDTYMNDDNHAARALVLRLGATLTGRSRFPDGLERDVFRLPRPNPMPASEE
ncbi:GNAT family N-acetyltransferase [Massilia sp. CCM 9210]|uniref:GNAT family N-acetyltransferase n=1 Tax=Massilia scottii TaxID=3057166 RepID=UPI0027968EF0|nr:GNAT family N-acetyltransferase [Massilia sp. CCM 9210]MDQ1818009.1 GNAT family N-acetyltransferase [Massilia sp. CCM 9210]